jgi:hypothetical protein
MFDRLPFLQLGKGSFLFPSSPILRRGSRNLISVSFRKRFVLESQVVFTVYVQYVCKFDSDAGHTVIIIQSQHNY